MPGPRDWELLTWPGEEGRARRKRGDGRSRTDRSVLGFYAPRPRESTAQNWAIPWTAGRRRLPDRRNPAVTPSSWNCRSADRGTMRRQPRHEGFSSGRRRGGSRTMGLTGCCKTPVGGVAAKNSEPRAWSIRVDPELFLRLATWAYEQPAVLDGSNTLLTGPAGHRGPARSRRVPARGQRLRPRVARYAVALSRSGGSGSVVWRTPVSTRRALVTAGSSEGSPGSPTPPEAASLCTMWTSMARGLSPMRSSG